MAAIVYPFRLLATFLKRLFLSERPRQMGHGVREVRDRPKCTLAGAIGISHQHSAIRLIVGGVFQITRWLDSPIMVLASANISPS
jgi:hypothetical protein